MSENKQKEFVVYRIYHIESGKSYIGITDDYKRRTREHFWSKDNCYIHRAIQKHGKEKFTTEIIFKCDSFEDAKKEEMEYIKVFNTMIPNGYNMTKGGDGTLGSKHSKETRKKMSIASKNPSEETRKKMSESAKNKPIMLKETRKKISEAGKNRSKETLKKMSEAAKNKPPATKKTRKKMSEARRTLSKDQVLEIRKMLSKGIFQYVIAKQFNVAQSTIGCIKRNVYYVEIQLS